jgi:hypothetical protein
MTTTATIDPATVPGIVQARIFAAADLQATRRRIARTLGRWYVLDERREPGRQRARDEAAHHARHWREVARSIGLRPAAVRRAVLATLVAADGRPLDASGRLALAPAR